MNQIIYIEGNNTLEFWFPYNQHQKDFVKNELKAQFESKDRRGKYWYVNADKINKEQLKAYIEFYNAEPDQKTLYKYNLKHEDITPTFTADKYQDDFVYLSSAQDTDLSDFDMSGFKIDLFLFQKAGAKYAYLKKRALIGDDMGLGKTYQALAVMSMAKIKKFIVVCPATIKINWQRAIKTAMPDLTTSIWGGQKGVSDVNVIIINYENLSKHLPSLLRFVPQGLICDEFHYVVSEKTKRSQAVAELAKMAEYVLGLTGTPFKNRPSDLIFPLTVLGRLDEFGGWMGFVRSYCQAFRRTINVKTKKGKSFKKDIWDISGASNLKELYYQLRSICMVRRRKVDVLTELPKKNRVQIVLEIDNRDDYNEAQDSIIKYYSAKVAADKAFLASIAHLSAEEKKAEILERKAEASKSAERAESLVLVSTLKQIAVNGKIAETILWIKDFLESGEKLLLFAIHQSVQQALLREFPDAARIIAEDNHTARQAQIDRFISDDECKLMIASLKAGGTGVDGLQKVCSNVGFLEFGWTPAEHLQGEDRLLRIEQTENVTAYYFIANNTIEETIQNMLAVKQAVADAALDGADEIKSGSIFNQLDDYFLKQVQPNEAQIIKNEHINSDVYCPECGQNESWIGEIQDGNQLYDCLACGHSFGVKIVSDG